MANVYRYLKSGNPEAFRLDPTGTNPVSLGDMVMYDTANFYALRLTAGNAPAFIGVAEGVGPTPASAIDNAPNLVDSVKVRAHGIFTFKKTTGDSLVHGDPLVIGADCQTVLKQTAEPDTEIIAYAWLPMASAALTGAGTVDAVLKCNAPATGIIV
jgi:predicted RecA/RadA family phage recombinase